MNLVAKNCVLSECTSPFWTHFKVVIQVKCSLQVHFSADTGPALLQAKKKVPEFILREGGFWMHLPTYLPTLLLVVNGHVQGFGFFFKEKFLPILWYKKFGEFFPRERKISQIFNKKTKKFQKLPQFFLAKKITKNLP